jgi:hypothetical protein
LAQVVQLDVEFTSIPATYTHLQIRCIQNSGGGSSRILRLILILVLITMQTLCKVMEVLPLLLVQVDSKIIEILLISNIQNCKCFCGFEML